MKNLLCSISVLISLIIASCSPKLQPVTIKNVQKIHSTYQIDKDPAAMNAINSLHKKYRKNNRIFTYSSEGSWPLGMRLVMDRYNNRETIKQYKAQILTSFSSSEKGTLYILEIPKKKNKHMSGNFKPQYDFFVIISEEGIQR